MRENRKHGSEGGEASAFPTPIGGVRGRHNRGTYARHEGGSCGCHDDAARHDACARQDDGARNLISTASANDPKRRRAVPPSPRVMEEPRITPR